MRIQDYKNAALELREFRQQMYEHELDGLLLLVDIYNLRPSSWKAK